MRKLIMSVIEPVDNRLEIDTQSSTYPPEAHSFQVHLDGLPSEFLRIAHRLLVRSEITATHSASHALGACAIEPGFLNRAIFPAIGACWLFHGIQFTPYPCFSSLLPLAGAGVAP